MKQPHVMKPAVCVMLSLFMHVALGTWIVHAIQPTHQNWQLIQPIQVSLVSEIFDPASGSEAGQVDQISELTHAPASISGDLESAPTQEAKIEQKTDPAEPGVESEKHTGSTADRKNQMLTSLICLKLETLRVRIQFRKNANTGRRSRTYG